MEDVQVQGGMGNVHAEGDEGAYWGRDVEEITERGLRSRRVAADRDHDGESSETESVLDLVPLTCDLNAHI